MIRTFLLLALALPSLAQAQTVSLSTLAASNGTQRVVATVSGITAPRVVWLVNGAAQPARMAKAKDTLTVTLPPCPARTVVQVAVSDATKGATSTRVLTACAPVVTPPPPPPPSDSPAELPRVALDTMVASARTAPVLRTLRATTAAELQAALDTSRYGDRIALTPGTTYVGTFTLRRKAGLGWITLTTSAPLDTGRMRPSRAANAPRLIAQYATEPVLQTDPEAAGYRIAGIEITARETAPQAFTLVALGRVGRAQTSAAQQPHRLVFDRVYVHGHATLDFQRCFALNGGATVVIDSWVSDCHGKGYDSQAIAGWNGTGPYLIQNNTLEGAGENVIFGGSDPGIVGLLPSDITIRGNHVRKPPEWRGRWTVKNLFELKLGARVLVEGNVFENNWVDGQAGSAILLYSVNQDGGAPWSEVRDVTFVHNVVRNSPHALNLAATWTGAPAVRMSRLYVAHNRFEQISGRLAMLDGATNWTFARNTGFGVTHGFILHGRAGSGLVFRDNVFGTLQANWGTWDFALNQDGGSYGLSALTALYGTAWTMTGNVVPGATAARFPTGNSYPPPGSAWPATVGADSVTLAARTAGVVISPN